MISRNDLAAAAEAIRAGELVAFPTETVYGLGANALDAAAVAHIYAAKERPASSPLIVHVASMEQARGLAAEWPAAAQALAERFWPGPLTLVVRKTDAIPSIVTAGLDTVGLRMPANEIALELIRAAGVPIAAPSANRFTELSPTRAEHVRKSLGDHVKMVLDGGACAVGIESTVVAVNVEGLEMLRPGTISRAAIEAVAGALHDAPVGDAHRAPGQHARHYRPKTPLYLLRADELPTDGRGEYLAIASRDANEYALRLYDTLHEMDARGLDWIAVEPPPDGPEWEGVRDRLRRAAR